MAPISEAWVQRRRRGRVASFSPSHPKAQSGSGNEPHCPASMAKSPLCVAAGHRGGSRGQGTGSSPVGPCLSEP